MSLSNRLGGVRTACRFLSEHRRSRAAHQLSADELNELQWRRVEKLLRFAYRHVPFYQRRFREAGLTPADIRTADDLRHIPPLTKADIQIHGEELKANRTHGRLYKVCSSGSTGEPTIVYWDHDTVVRHHAVFLRNLTECGYRLGERLPQIAADRVALTHPELIKAECQMPRGGSIADQIAILSSGFFPRTLLSVFDMNEESMGRFADWMRREQPSILTGFTIAIDHFAQFLERRGVDDIRPRGVMTTAESPSPSTVARLEKVFGCSVANRYATNEINGIAQGCRHAEAPQGRMHVNQEAVFLETTRDGRQVGEGELGRVLVTDLLNYSMPLIRYDLLDMARKAPGRCPCGRSAELLDPVEGRVDEFFVLPGDRLMNAAFFRNVFHHNPGIVRYQVVQDSPERIDIKIVKEPDRFDAAGFDESQRMITEHVGPEVLVATEFVSEIPNEANGKFRYTISRVYRKTLEQGASSDLEEVLT